MCVCACGCGCVCNQFKTHNFFYCCPWWSYQNRPVTLIRSGPTSQEPHFVHFLNSCSFIFLTECIWPPLRRWDLNNMETKITAAAPPRLPMLLYNYHLCSPDTQHYINCTRTGRNGKLGGLFFWKVLGPCTLMHLSSDVLTSVHFCRAQESCTSGPQSLCARNHFTFQ